KQKTAKEKGKKYEDEVITKMRDLGMDVIKTTETTNSGQIIGDKGIDAIIQDKNGIIFVQIKDWRRNVGTDIIAQMIGILSKNPGSKGMIISKQGFTKTAIEEVKNRKENDLILINGESEIEEKYEKLSEMKLEKKKRIHWIMGYRSIKKRN